MPEVNGNGGAQKKSKPNNECYRHLQTFPYEKSENFHNSTPETTETTDTKKTTSKEKWKYTTYQREHQHQHQHQH